MLELLAVATIPGVVLVATAALGARLELGRSARSAVQHLAAGVVIAVVAVEVLPELLAAHEPWLVTLGLAIGAVGMVAIATYAERIEARAGDAAGGLLAALGVDLAIDGLLLGIAYALGSAEGRIIAAAVTFELASIGFALGSRLSSNGWGPQGIVATAAGLGALQLSLAVLGWLGLDRLPTSAQVVALAIGAAALLYLVTEELLSEAHEVPELPWQTAVFFAGFIAVFLIESSA